MYCLCAIANLHTCICIQTHRKKSGRICCPPFIYLFSLLSKIIVYNGVIIVNEACISWFCEILWHRVMSAAVNAVNTESIECIFLAIINSLNCCCKSRYSANT